MSNYYCGNRLPLNKHNVLGTVDDEIFRFRDANVDRATRTVPSRELDWTGLDVRLDECGGDAHGGDELRQEGVDVDRGRDFEMLIVTSRPRSNMCQVHREFQWRMGG